LKKLLVTGTALIVWIPAAAEALELSANGGWSSEYIFRGIPQDDSSAFAGLDAGHEGFYAGTWAADVGQGLETDWYGGYGATYEAFDYGIGLTWYTYTDDFDDEYIELNLNGAWRFLTLDVAIGEYDNFGGPTLDYQFYALTGEYRKFYATAGIFEDDFDGEYLEAGYGDTLIVADTELFDYSLSVIFSSDELIGTRDDTSLVFSVSKTFDIDLDR